MDKKEREGERGRKKEREGEREGGSEAVVIFVSSCSSGAAVR